MANKIIKNDLTSLLNNESLQTKVAILEKSKNAVALSLDLIKRNPFQPRTNFDEDALNDLAISIKKYGVLEPIIVRERAEGYYEIVCGERRFRASQIANLKTIPSIIEDFSDQEMSEIALIENIQRENLSPLEISSALHTYQKQHNCTQYDLAKVFGKSRSYIANMMRLSYLPNSIKDELENHNLSVGHVRTLIGLNEEEAKEFLKEIKGKNLNVRETEALVSSIKSKRDNNNKKDKENALKRKLNTNVKLTNKKIEIEYSSPEELEQILKQLIGK